ncbi:MAG: HAMP domain-containing histidine kinase [Propionibacteriaceae bacterium]|nr:HAMP domain-containing histidine kinase [Propionibacteriaceae bacterium]
MPDQLQRVLTAPARLWRSSLSLRVMVTILAVAGVLMAVGGAFILDYDSVDDIRDAVFVVFISALVLIAIVSLAIVRQVILELRRVSSVAAGVARGDLNRRLKVSGSDDLAMLAASVNAMAATLSGQIAKLEEASEMQRRFVSDVSHELRTPLTTVKMASELLEDEQDQFDEVTQRAVSLLHTEIERFEVLLNDLLEMSRFDAGAATLTLETTDLVSVVRAEIEQMMPLAIAQETPLILHAKGQVMAQFDVRRVQRILRNLITNALDYGEHRSIVVQVAGNDHAVAIRVRDHGQGFEPEQAERVFARFWRGDPSRKRNFGGNGLGLAICKEDAMLHGGWLEAWSLPGVGAVFRLTLPTDPSVGLMESPLPLRPPGMVWREDEIKSDGRGNLRVSKGAWNQDGTKFEDAT